MTDTRWGINSPMLNLDDEIIKPPVGYLSNANHWAHEIAGKRTNEIVKC